MELRKLSSKDIFPVCGIIKKIGLKEVKSVLNGTNLMELAKNDKKINMEAVSVDIMLDLVGIVIANLPECQKEIYTFLESIVIVEEDKRKNLRKDLENMPMDEFAQLIIDVLTKEEFKDFFKVALKLSK